MKTDFILAALFGVLALAGCREWSQPDAKEAAAVWQNGILTMRIYEPVVDGCHYLTTSGGGIIHKANCTNHVNKP